VSSGAWTAVGTIALAVVTVAAVITTIVITAQDRSRSGAQLQAEHQAALEREQLTEAYAVQVVAGEVPVRGEEPGETEIKRLAAFVVNRGRYTITQVAVQFSPDGSSLVAHHRYGRVSGFEEIPAGLRDGWRPLERETAMSRVLTPWDTGLVFETDRMHVRFLASRTQWRGGGTGGGPGGSITAARCGRSGTARSGLLSG
jgi:hypothetical protein